MNIKQHLFLSASHIIDCKQQERKKNLGKIWLLDMKDDSRERKEKKVDIFDPQKKKEKKNDEKISFFLGYDVM